MRPRRLRCSKAGAHTDPLAFDRYLERDNNALTTEQKRGGLLFFGKALCSTCHNGPFLGVQGLANVGAPQIGPGGAGSLRSTSVRERKGDF
jgi:cytochrome c peroxidase